MDRLEVGESIRIQVCPKNPGLGPLHSYSGDGIGPLNPIRSGGVWILSECYSKSD